MTLGGPSGRPRKRLGQWPPDGRPSIRPLYRFDRDHRPAPHRPGESGRRVLKLLHSNRRGVDVTVQYSFDRADPDIQLLAIGVPDDQHVDVAPGALAPGRIGTDEVDALSAGEVIKLPLNQGLDPSRLGVEVFGTSGDGCPPAGRGDSARPRVTRVSPIYRKSCIHRALRPYLTW